MALLGRMPEVYIPLVERARHVHERARLAKQVSCHGRHVDTGQRLAELATGDLRRRTLAQSVRFTVGGGAYARIVGRERRRLPSFLESPRRFHVHGCAGLQRPRVPREDWTAGTLAASSAGNSSRGRLQCDGTPRPTTFGSAALAASVRMHSATSDVSLALR